MGCLSFWQWHDWEKWAVYSAKHTRRNTLYPADIMRNPDGSPLYEVKDIQQRRCARCGLVQRRDLS